MNQEVECKTHPDAPHGFVRNASHTEDRLVCECEYWEEPKVNERIRLLAEQARKHYPGTELSGEYWVFDEQLFAQLIVAKCVEVVENLSPGYKDYRDQIEDAFRRDCVIEIKKHFGVEP